MEVKRINFYQSFGAGVNSVALSLLLPDNVERVFSDTGAEQPETYEYLKEYVKTHKLTILNDPVQGCKDLETWCIKLKHAPFITNRACSFNFKHRRLERYYKKPCEVNIGIAYDERHRARIYEKKTRGGMIYYKYPLIDQGITRDGCIKIIKEAGLPVPVKSGCWLCPFNHKSDWIRIMRKHPDLFDRAIIIDELSPKIKLYDYGLRNLKGRVDLGKEQSTLFDKDEETESWECNFCFIDLRR